MKELKTVCPAARPIGETNGPRGFGPGVVCHVVRQERLQTDQIVFGRWRGEKLTLKDDSMQVLGFCCGTGIPVEDLPPQGRGHYTGCPLWRAAQERDWEGREYMVEPARRPSVLPFGGLLDPEEEAARVREELGEPDEWSDPQRILEAAQEMAEEAERDRKALARVSG